MNEIERAINDLDDLKNCDSISSSHFKEVHGKNLELAISALEKQIPKKPIEVIDEKGWEDWVCQECRTLIEGGSVMLHCWNCGQKLDWSVEE